MENEKGKEKKVRKLTKAEIKRMEQLKVKEEELKEKGYQREDLTIGIARANIMAILLGAPPGILFVLLYCARFWGTSAHRIDVSWMTYMIMILAIVVHEGIHGFFWGLFAEHGFKSVEFGFIKEYLTPYCTCSDPLKKNHYIIGALMPTIILGLIPMIASLFTGSLAMLAFGIFMYFGGGGDQMIILKLLKYKQKEGKEVIFLDHPYECGLIAFRK